MAKPTSTARVGARRRSEIPEPILAQLHRGEIETVTLVEGLAIDFARLLASAAPELPASALDEMEAAAPLGITRRMAVAAGLLLEHFGPAGYLRLLHHRADTVRGWAA